MQSQKCIVDYKDNVFYLYIYRDIAVKLRDCMKIKNWGVMVQVYAIRVLDGWNTFLETTFPKPTKEPGFDPLTFKLFYYFSWLFT